MHAIDFARLRRIERQKARQRAAEPATAPAPPKHNENDDNSTTTLPPWPLSREEEEQEEAWINTTTTTSCFDPQRHLVCAHPPALYYTPHFVSDEGAAALVDWLQALPANDNNNNNNSKADDAYRQALGKWTTLRHAKRRVAMWDAQEESSSSFPPPLACLVQALHQHVWPHVSSSSSSSSSYEYHAINHILVNEYYTATQGILAHTDGPAYEPCTATLSLASDAVLHFTCNKEKDDNNHKPTRRTVWLAPQSLVVFTQDLYQTYRHAIAEDCTTEHLTQDCCNGTVGQAVHRGPLRYSLTFRCKRRQGEEKIKDDDGHEE